MPTSLHSGSCFPQREMDRLFRWLRFLSVFGDFGNVMTPWEAGGEAMIKDHIPKARLTFMKHSHNYYLI